MRLTRWLTVALVFLALPAAAQTLPRGVQTRATLGGITEYAYPNGLRVLLFPNPSNPKVTVNITYLVGSRFEGYGETGMAHLLEHLLFIRSTNNREIKNELTAHGAQWNGGTSYDRTNYFETVTAGDDNLKWALGLEAERMVNMRMEKPLLDTEMTVVRNEFERGENSAQNVLEERVLSTMYLWHNYGKSVIGSRADIERVPIDRLAAFYRKYYQPDNAILVIAGQFDQSTALAMVADSLGKIPRPSRKLDDMYTLEPVQDGERYVELRRVGTNPVVMAAWHAPALSHPDSAPLEVLAGVMAGGGGGRGGGGGTGRLTKALVDTKKATAVRMSFEDMHDPGWVEAAATLSKDQSLEDARKTMLDTIAGAATDPPTTEEVERAKTRIIQGLEAGMTNSQQAALRLSNSIASGDWRLLFVNYDQIRKVTPADVARVARLYFKPSNRTIGEFIPTPDPDRVDVPAAPDIETTLKDYKTDLVVSAGEAFDPSPENIERHLVRAALPNGMKLVMLPRTTRGGVVTAIVQLRFGDEKSLAGQRATAEMAGALLMRGTRTKTRQQLQDEMLKLNARIAVTGGPTRATANIQTTQANLPKALALAVEMLREPAFPEAEFDVVKKQRIAAIENSRTDPASLASLALERSLQTFSRTDVRYVPTIDEEIQDANAVTIENVRAFHSRFYGASHGEIAVVGQVDPNEVKQAATSLFGSWTSSTPYERITTPYQKATAVNLKIETPDKQNATFSAGVMFPMTDADADYAAMIVANYLFGGSLSGRAPNRIRNQEGLSYGVNSRFAAPAAGNAATFGLVAISNPANTPKVESSFRDELAKALASGFTAEEVAGAKNALRDQRVVGRTQDQGLAGLLAAREEYGRTIEWDQRMDAKLQAVTVDEVNAAFRRHVTLDQVSIVKAGDFKAGGAYQATETQGR